MDEKLWKDKEVLAKGLSYGIAFDAMMYSNRRITRDVWGGWWQVEEVEGIGKTIVAYLKDGVTKAPAQPYQADMMAHDWIILGDKEIEIPRNEEYDVFKYIKLTENGINLLNSFRAEFEYRIVNGSTKALLQHEYEKAKHQVERDAYYPVENEVMKLFINRITSLIEKQIYK